jgi:hypothetical protein
MFEDLDPNTIQEENVRELVKRLLNVIEGLSADLREARAEIQRLRDEVNRLKGEEGQPKMQGQKKRSAPRGEHSSEGERRQKRKRHKKSKKSNVSIQREEVLEVDRARLPADAREKGYQRVVVQDVRLEAANVLFYKEKYYSASKRKTYLAPLPEGYAGQFGPGIKSLVVTMYFGSGRVNRKSGSFCETWGCRSRPGKSRIC